MTDQEAYKMFMMLYFKLALVCIMYGIRLLLTGRRCWYENKNDVYLYQIYRFTSTNKLVPAEMMEGVKPNPEHRKEIAV